MTLLALRIQWKIFTVGNEIKNSAGLKRYIPSKEIISLARISTCIVDDQLESELIRCWDILLQIVMSLANIKSKNKQRKFIRRNN